MSAPRGVNALRDFYGNVCVVWDAETCTWNLAPEDWEDDSCVVARELPGLAGKKLYIHRKIEAPLREALRLCAERCPEYKIETIGCFNPRPTRPAITRLKETRRLVDGATVNWGTGISFHSVAGAVDVNASRNRMRTGRSREERWWDIPDAFFQAFRDVGWTCGVDFNPHSAMPARDPMHFQYGAL